LCLLFWGGSKAQRKERAYSVTSSRALDNPIVAFLPIRLKVLLQLWHREVESLLILSQAGGAMHTGLQDTSVVTK
jgi:hypothetical protein